MTLEENLIEIVGPNNVIRELSALETYFQDISFVNKVKPQLAIKPKNTEEVKQIIDFAKKTLTPLVPVSSGLPHFRGDTVPTVGGAVMVDLSDMKKVLRVDRLNRVAMFEPGVTFNELIPAVEKEGLRLNMPLLPRKSKSVVGSMLEREPPIMPKYHWDIADPLNCVEVVLGTGDIFRTGAAAGPGTLQEQWANGGAQAEGAGPSSASWYRVIQGSQGTMGIVTWASARCEILPKVEAPFLAGSQDLNKVMEMVHWLIRLRLVNECFVLNNTTLSVIMAQRWSADFQKIKETLPAWILFFNVAGYDYSPEERVKGQIQDIYDLSQRIGTKPVKSIANVSAFELLKIVKQPSGEPYWKLRPKGACQDIFFLTNFNNLANLIKVMGDICDEDGYPSSKMGIYVQPIVQGTNFHCEFNLYYDPQNSKESQRVQKLSTVAIQKLIGQGAFFSRPYGEESRIIINRDAASVATLKKVKSILDPLNIMNPGKLCF